MSSAKITSQNKGKVDIISDGITCKERKMPLNIKQNNTGLTFVNSFWFCKIL